MLKLAFSPGKGRGDFAARKISAGEIIEECPVIIVPSRERENLKKTVLIHYFFQWGDAPGSDCAICLGLGSIYNHAEVPNAKYFRLFESFLIRFVALKEILEGEEICTNYNGKQQGRSFYNFDTPTCSSASSNANATLRTGQKSAG